MLEESVADLVQALFGSEFVLDVEGEINAEASIDLEIDESWCDEAASAINLPGGKNNLD